MGELRPARRRFVAREVLLEAFRRSSRLDVQRLRDELDEVAYQDVEPRV